MKVHLLIIGRVDGHPTPHDESYLVSYDPDGLDGRGLIVSSEDKVDAKSFDSVQEALELWKRPSTIAPLRHDGKPNRPLTAYNVELAWTD